MGDIAQRGNKLTKGINYDKAYVKSRSLVKDVYDAVAPKHSLGIKKKPHSSKEGVTASLGRTVRDVRKILSPERVKKFGGGRTNLLEELGRVEAEPSNRNRRAEISRVHGELNRGYAKGGRAGFSHGRRVGSALKKFRDRVTHEVPTGPHTDVKRRGINPSFKKKMEKAKQEKSISQRQAPQEEPRTIGRAEGGRIGFKKGTDKKWIQKAVNPKHKGYCTPMTKKTCTPARKALARTFKKKAKTGW
jgi:hypothetical protein